MGQGSLLKAEEFSGGGCGSSPWIGAQPMLMQRPKRVKLGCVEKLLVLLGGWSGMEAGKDESGVKSHKALS